MKCATFDNPATMARECWRDGEVIAHLSANAMSVKGFRGHPSIFFGLDVGRPWESGKIVGNSEAIK